MARGRLRVTARAAPRARRRRGERRRSKKLCRGAVCDGGRRHGRGGGGCGVSKRNGAPWGLRRCHLAHGSVHALDREHDHRALHAPHAPLEVDGGGVHGDTVDRCHVVADPHLAPQAGGPPSRGAGARARRWVGLRAPRRRAVARRGSTLPVTSTGPPGVICHRQRGAGQHELALLAALGGGTAGRSARCPAPAWGKVISYPNVGGAPQR